MEVHIVIEDETGKICYEKPREMEIIPNIGEGILLDLDEVGGWSDDKYYCHYAVCYEKYQVFRGAKTDYFVLRFRGDDFYREKA